jgi:aldose 1-epimerase
MKVTKHKTELPGKKEDVFFFLLEHDSGARARISNYGGIISSLEVRDRYGLFRDIVLGFDDIASYVDTKYRSAYPYFGTLIGRYANRIKNGRFTLNNSEYQLPTNLGNDTLHGGLEGFDSKIWSVLEYGTAPEPYIVLNYLSPAGEEGFPGTLSITLTYELNKNGLTWKLEAETGAPTIFNPAQHTYFNLEGGTGTIGTHHVKIYGNRYMEQDAAFNVTGKLLDAKNTPLDFSSTKQVNRDWDVAQGYDQTFIIDEYNGDLKLSAEAAPEDGSLLLQVYTTEPVVHFYTGRWIPEVIGKKGVAYGPYSGLCFETQHHPNAINLHGYPKTILEPGTLFKRTDRFLVI